MPRDSLVYVDDSLPGITRRAMTAGWGYYDPRGARITDREEIGRLNGVGMPPAYGDCWFCPSANGHIQATGYDDRGRKQYRYHPIFRAAREAEKYDGCACFGLALPLLRGRIESDLATRALSRERTVAAVVRLLDLGKVRVGNEQYARDNKSYGATTLRRRHADLKGRTLRLTYRAKSGKQRTLSITDSALLRFVRAVQDLPGQHLFQYLDDAGEAHPVTSSDVNAYIAEAMGAAFTAKHFRTWGASVLAFEALCDGAGSLKAMIAPVAEALGNTPAISRKSYIHPALLALAKDGSEPWREGLRLPRKTRYLSRYERGLINLLEGIEATRQCGWPPDDTRRTRMTAPKKAQILDIPADPIGLQDLWDITVAWFSVHAVQIALAAGAGFLIYLALAALRAFGKRIMNAKPEHLGYGAVVGSAVAKTTHIFMVMVAARLVAGYANPPDVVLQTVRFLFTVAAVFQAAIWAREIIIGFIERRTGKDANNDTLANAMGIIRILVSVALFAIATVVVLDNLGVNVSGLVAGLGIGGIAIGLAAQGIFSDLFAALSIIFDKPFRRGEIITYDTTTARVERIGLKSTRLRAMSGEGKVISNANLLQKEITSLQMLSRRRIKFALGVIYQTPQELAERIPDILKAVVESEGMIYIHAGLVAFGASSLDFEMEFDVPDPDTNDFFMTRHKVGLAILKRFNAEKIAFAYPTQMSFTAAPDGRTIMPYPEGKKADEA